MKFNNKYFNLTYLILILLIVFIIFNRRSITFDIFILIYKIYSLFGYYARNNKYPIDYPYDREDIIPENYMKEFNNICYNRQITGNNQYKMLEMKELVKNIESYCIKNLTKQTPRPLVVLYPYQNKDDMKKMKFYIKNKFPFVIRGGNWKTNIQNTNIDTIIDKYGETTVMFDENNHTFRDKLKSIRDHKAYLSNSTSFMKKHPEIVNSEDIKKLQSSSGLSPTISQMFLSLVSGNGTPMHSAFSDNFFFMIEGRKKWTFWHPDYLCLTYPHFPDNGVYFGSLSGIRDSTDPIIAKHFRLLQYAPSYEITLEEGDVLFNPGPWWHAIKNMSYRSLAIATRWVYNDIFPSVNQLQYCQIQNPKLYNIIKNIYINTGDFKMDVDENYSGELNEESISLVEILNHSTLKALNSKFRFHEWHESFKNLFHKNKI